MRRKKTSAIDCRTGGCTGNNFYQEFSRVMHDPTRAGRIRRHFKTRGWSRVGSASVGNPTGRVERSRVRRFQISWDRSNWVTLTRSDPRDVIRLVNSPHFYQGSSQGRVDYRVSDRASTSVLVGRGRLSVTQPGPRHCKHFVKRPDPT